MSSERLLLKIEESVELTRLDASNEARRDAALVQAERDVLLVKWIKYTEKQIAELKQRVSDLENK